MLSIGELAHRTGVSVRMLRHYDALGLVTPERVDAATGYRWYAPSQIGRVNSLVALKELGFSLDRCRSLLDEHISCEEMLGLLRLRRTELEERVAADRRRLAGVERRLRSIEMGIAMTTTTLRFEPLPALRLARLSGEVNDTSEIGALVAALSAELAAARSAGHDVAAGGRVCTYYGSPDGSKIEVGIGFRLTPGQDPGPGLELVELPAVDRAAVVTHRRPDYDGTDPWLTIDAALAERGLESFGPYGQVHLEGGGARDESSEGGGDVIEFQCPVRDSGGSSRSDIGCGSGDRRR